MSDANKINFLSKLASVVLGVVWPPGETLLVSTPLSLLLLQTILFFNVNTLYFKVNLWLRPTEALATRRVEYLYSNREIVSYAYHESLFYCDENLFKYFFLENANNFTFKVFKSIQKTNIEYVHF